MTNAGIEVAIVGAGIAGLTLAAGLSRSGVTCRVYEQAEDLREVGAGVQLAPNATKILYRLGLGPRLEAAAVQPVAVEMRSWDSNEVIGRIAHGDECTRLFGAPYLVLHRADLQRALLGLLPDGMLRLGSRCTGVRTAAGKVRLEFQDGSSAVADAVIGADGIHSVIRRELADDRPRFSGQVIYRGLAPAGRLPHLLTEPKVILWLGPHQHCVCYPVSAGDLISVGATTQAGQWQAESWSATGRPEDMAAAYAGWNYEVRAVLGALDSVALWALHDRDAITCWSRGRITLAGDAAHPMLPFMAQGANQAVEDAAVLAWNLARAGAEQVPACLERYQLARIARTATVQQISRDNAKVFHLADGSQQQQRDSRARVHLDLRSQQWLYGFEPGAGDTSPYPEEAAWKPTT